MSIPQIFALALGVAIIGVVLWNVRWPWQHGEGPDDWNNDGGIGHGPGEH